MLPSKGFFKKNDCPYFEKGLCVRPHCHFRHRKKVLNDESLNRDGDEAEEDEEAVSRLIDEYKTISDVENKACPGPSESNNSENKSTHSTLFAKLVNQSNSYETNNRHIPCAYTPTPQTRKSEVKSKSVSAVAGFADSEKSLELITKARTLLQNYCAENIKKVDTKDAQSSDNKSECVDVEKSLSTKDAAPKISFISKSQLETNGADGPVTLESCKEEKSKEAHSVERSDNKIIPDCTQSEEIRNNEEIRNSAVNSTSISELDAKIGDKMGIVSELNLISSEIEMMEKMLKEDEQCNKMGYWQKESGESIQEKENKNNKDESREHRKDRSHFSRSSRHDSKSSRSHSSSRSRQSSSHSSRHSRSSSSSNRHHSSSSRHHSLTGSGKSSRYEESPSRHSRDHKKKRHSENCEPERRKRSASQMEIDGDIAEKSVESNVKSSSASEEDEDEEEDDDDMEINDSLTNQDTLEEEDWTVTSRKRKNSLDMDFQVSKYISVCNSEDIEDDPDTIEKECLEIFNSYSNVSGNQTKGQEITVANSEYESTIQTKKRTAHSTNAMSDHSALRFKTVKKMHTIKAAQELMLERYKIAEKSREAEMKPPQSSPAPILGLNKPSVRIAAVSNIQQMLLAKKKIQEKINQGIKVNERTTIAQTVSQGGSRVAHVPKVSDMKDKPTIMEGSKQVPRVKRQTYMEKLLIETSKIFPTKGEACEEALKLEQEIFKLHSGSTAAYHAAFVSLLMKTRRRVASVKGETPNVNTSKPKVSHFDVLSGGKKNFSVIKTKKVDINMLTDKQIYWELLRCKLTTEELKENGFPMSSERPGYATCTLNLELKYNEKYQYIKKITGNRRYCIRCSKLYDVDPRTWKQCIEGPETCSYHPGRKKSGGRNCERIYNCCNTSSTEGCMSHVRHVTDSNDYENYPNCVRTLEKEGETDPGVYALDCEMVYTRLGSELARVTVVNLKKEIVYDTLVKPKYPIECYNTFYSGIEEKMLEGVETTLTDVQAVLLSMFSNKTILIGHSLDSDLRALHLIHDTVVDTSIVFKNERYFPYKYSLKDLCAKKISKIIQDNVNGHDSSEDAIAALEIMLQHVKEEVAKYDSLETYEADRCG